tara:strand:+ start:1325 stop:2302 length:978 start_codon:yes stop_codon:yes gene_type:complete
MITLILIFLFVTVGCNESKSNEETIYGCMRSGAINYNSNATIDDGSCEVLGCTDSTAINFNPDATIEDFNCLSSEDSYQNYSLAWNDEFNGATLDTLKWNIELMSKGTVNNELQTYVNSHDNIYLENGDLVIKAIKDNPFNASSPGYTSGRLNTSGKVSFGYGKLEIRAKIPSGVGTWPAIWMLGDLYSTLGWPQCGEIDIMEHVGYDPGHFHSNLHSQLYNFTLNNNPNGSIYSSLDSYNIFTLDWLENNIRVKVNGIIAFEYSKTEEMNFYHYPFNNQFYMILNLAIGGDWGAADKSVYSSGIDNSIFPVEMYIDYIRYYQPK